MTQIGAVLFALPHAAGRRQAHALVGTWACMHAQAGRCMHRPELD
jgi:hypothetical protein